jgi:hypothetical protein
VSSAVIDVREREGENGGISLGLIDGDAEDNGGCEWSARSRNNKCYVASVVLVVKVELSAVLFELLCCFHVLCAETKTTVVALLPLLCV